MDYYCNLSKYRGAIFDMDGTLVDSDTAIAKAIAPWCQRHQLDIEQVLKDGRGVRFEDYVKQHLPHLDLHQEVQHLEGAEGTFAKYVEEIAGAKTFLTHLQQLNLPWALATSADRDNAVKRMKTCDLPIPMHLIGAEDVQQGKPDPEPFTAAANKLGLPCRECVVFEDSDAGVQAALSAGCDVVVVGRFCQLSHPNIVARINDYTNWNARLLQGRQAC
ncbi:HAD-IA family hydrolase [Pseudoalteromonas umbrosa]|uniref:HAD-IA family hydrolase n=1 Tax=Pseudoalteromonas umbrosa TaxID=3048489 RepID=UPI0024C2389B|nr:HAD-IA family hydrolase [Pseudoalteromonas sp. B95]MDK1288581.1 HAD-IA family hydrolase [Pseudoalteromonas sp. B95]